ncbi:MAG: PQQ-binding-like beta-propeller repeat protein [Bryobacteraceae bacterium]
MKLRQAALLISLSLCLLAEDWPEFRGPTGQGHSTERGLPLTWSESENVRWKAPIPGRGWSSPAILGDRIWLTSSLNDGGSLHAISLDRESGRVLLDVEVFRPSGGGPMNQKNNHASPTPILEGDRVYVHFGPLGTACLSSDGKVLWKQKLSYEPQHGPGGSPALHGDLLIINCDGLDTQYVTALDKKTGRVRWKSPRRGSQAYVTPLMIRVGERSLAISTGAFRTVAYEPETGKEVWSVRYGQGFSNVPRPVYAHGLVFLCTGFFEPRLLAVRPDGKGDVTESHVAWSAQRGVPLTPSPIVVGNELYMVSDNGILSCLDAKTGKPHYQQRLGGNFSASPVFADGRIYFLNEDGEASVIAPGTEFKKLATNRIDERTLASFAVAGGSIFIRGERRLYRVVRPAGR